MTTNSKNSSEGSPFTPDHFRAYAGEMVFEDGETREPEDWQMAFVEDVFAGAREAWLIVPEGNGKSTFFAQLALYGLDYSSEPWIPVGAASRDQAEIIYGQAAGFIRRTPLLRPRFRAYDGYRKVKSLRNGGKGMKVYAHDPNTGDGVIPFPYALIDEPHRHPDMKLYGLWKGKLRKRKAQILVISTAGEPGAPFEEMREKIRRKAKDRKRKGSFLRAAGDGLVFHEYMVQDDEDCEDIEAVKAANPLTTITTDELAEDYASPTLDLGDWKRLKCNRATRSSQTAISDAEWDKAQVKQEWIEGESIDLGLDVAWKWDTTVFTPLWNGPKYRLIGPAKILTPPRNGSTLDPDEIKNAFLELAELNQPETVVMDTSKAEDIASWLEEQGVAVIERGNTNQPAVQDYEAVMEGLRNATLKHTGDPGLRAHVLNAIARRLPGGDRRFDRPSTTRQNVKAQDRRVIDGLTAMGMVVYISTVPTEKSKSRYADPDASLVVA